MKILRRTFLFVLTFVLGVQMAAFGDWSSRAIPDISAPEEREPFDDQKSVAPEGIRLMYAGMEPARGDEIAYLRFVVYNGTSSRVGYASHGAEWPFPGVWVNGKKSPGVLMCGNGMGRYFIEPGASAEFRLGVYEFETVPKKSDLITIGFYLDAGLAEDVLSQPFVLPDSFRRSIEAWHKQQAGE